LMTNKVSVLGIGMLMVGAFIVLPYPYFSMTSLVFYLLLYIPYLLFTLYLDMTGKVRDKKLKGYAGYFCLLLFAISFAAPALKQFNDSLFLQVFMMIIFVVIHIVVLKNSRFFYGIVLPEGSKSKKYSFIYWGLFIAIIVVGGGHYTAPRYFSLAYGQETAYTFYSILFLLISYLLAIFSASLTYKFRR
jgi:hypothetical protein